VVVVAGDMKNRRYIPGIESPKVFNPLEISLVDL
jgi:hypothetical protein